MNLDLLKALCAIPATAGDESKMTEYILKYFSLYSKDFKSMPQVFSGAGFQDMVIAVFGQPRTAVFAHMDSVGFCVAHKKELVKIGNPKAENGTKLVGEDAKGPVECTLIIEKPKKEKKPHTEEPVFRYKAKRHIAPGTPLTYKPDWKKTKEFVNSAYMDNRVGVWNALTQAHTMEHGAIVFTTYEETGGGGAQFAGKFLQDNFGIQQAIISDVTLLSPSIKHKKGVAISMRDRGIPRQSFVRIVIQVAKDAGIPYQLEVEKAGGSDGNSLQMSSFAWDWCFVGPPEDNYHRPGEKVALTDIKAMLDLYKALLEKL
jgi:putative aminopeptidase FrvX